MSSEVLEMMAECRKAGSQGPHGRLRVGCRLPVKVECVEVRAN